MKESDKATRKQLRGYMKRLSGITNESLKEYGEKNPEFWKLQKSADNAFATKAESEWVSRSLEKVLKGKIYPNLEKILPVALHFAGKALPALGSLKTAAATPLYYMSRFAYRYAKSPELRRYYNNLITGAMEDNPRLIKSSADKLEKELSKAPISIPKKAQDPLPKENILKEQSIPPSKPQKSKVSSASEIREKLAEKKKVDISDRIERSKETQKRLQKHLKENPKSENAKKLLEQSKKLQTNSEKLLKELEEEGEAVIHQDLVKSEKRAEKKSVEKKSREKANIAAKYEPPKANLDLPKVEIKTSKEAEKYLDDLFPLLKKDGKIREVKFNYNKNNARTPYSARISHPNPDIYVKENPGSGSNLAGYGRTKEEAVQNLAKEIYGSGKKLGEKYPEVQFSNFAPTKKLVPKSKKPPILSQEETWSTQNIQKTLDKIDKELAELKAIKHPSADVTDKIKSNEKMKKMFQELFEESKVKKIE
ncbi:MAG: hypothetical protein AABY22_27265 [Nanoarchaeota archaeon]